MPYMCLHIYLANEHDSDSEKKPVCKSHNLQSLKCPLEVPAVSQSPQTRVKMFGFALERIFPS